MNQSAKNAALFSIFLLSGISGLVYEVVWLRILTRVFGVTVYAVSTVLIVFMTGLALGAFFAGRYTARKKLDAAGSLRLYAILEVGIGVTAFGATLFMPLLTPVFVGAANTTNSEVALLIVRLVLSVLVLLPPTFLMGATLPVLSVYLGSKKVGLLYGINTLGAVLGVLASAFLLLPELGEKRTAFAGAALNVLVGAMAFLLSRANVGEAAPEEAVSSAAPPPLVATLLAIYAVSGFCALCYQVIWSRLLILLLGNSVYGFSSMLAVYLLGVAAGSVVINALLPRIKRPLAILAVLEVLVALLAIASIHTFVAIGTSDVKIEYLFSPLASADDFKRLPIRALLIVLPTTLILGAIFPVVTRLAGGAKAVGRIYGWNTVGAIAGSFLSGFFLLPILGTLMSFLLVSLISVLLGAYLFYLDAKQNNAKAHVPLLASLLVFAVVASFSFEDPFLAVLKARLPADEKIVRHREDKAATVTVTEFGDGSGGLLYINGLHVSGTGFTGRFMMHLPLLHIADPKTAVVVGFGVGEAFRGSIDHHIDTTVVDLLPAVVESFPIFEPDPDKYLKSPKAHVVINDGRNFLLRSSQDYDAVLVDGSPPIYASGMVNLYSLEFVELVRDHLTPDGIFTLWVPSRCFERDFWMIARNFIETFPTVRTWTRPELSGVFLFGTMRTTSPFDLTREQLLERLNARQVPGLTADPSGVAAHIASGFFLSEEQIEAYAKKFSTVTDDRPYTEFPLGEFLRGAKVYPGPEFLMEAGR